MEIDQYEDETAAVAALLRLHHPAAQLDVNGRVVTAGFLCAPGAPDSGTVRVGHRVAFPSTLNGHTFEGNAAEEFVLVGAYADLLRTGGWTVRELRGDRPRLLARRPRPGAGGQSLPAEVTTPDGSARPRRPVPGHGAPDRGDL
ncbi:hypothetical protein [Kitasatospora kifunensis]|uniref:Uncharacterized protein n=1 Tax=Kitasatospora kifunensis TaxID=58351 RepID=A0A7W7RBW3_KITKI|nr:hypothetical protein [Kitasatospora kifunensis]MBB4929079.1 hypothetical protein [Kitasatospora kifunensis]